MLMVFFDCDWVQLSSCSVNSSNITILPNFNTTVIWLEFMALVE